MQRAFRTLLLTACAILWLTIQPVAAAPIEFHVAPGGNDKAAGTAKAPFRTLARARDAIRALKRGKGLPEGGARVILHGGVYRLEEPFTLGPEDSGTAKAPIIYMAAPGERPVISGGRIIRGLRRQADGSWSVTLPEAAGHRWVFRQLFINGRRYIHARSPNDGQFYIVRSVPDENDPNRKAKDRFAFRGNDIQPWPNLSDVEIRVTFSWNDGHFPIQAVDTENRIVTLAGPAVWELPKPGMPTCGYIVENHPGACDAPGEWQLNRETGELRVIPFEGEDLSDAEVIAPVIECLVLAKGDPEKGRYVEHVRFHGLSFQHAAWHLPPDGFSTPQAACKLGAALEFHAARHCAVTRCEVACVGRYAIWFDLDSSYNEIRRCHLHDLGAGGVRIGDAERPAGYERVAHHNVVDNNFIHNGGHIHPGATGIFMAYGHNNVFSHNEVSDLRYTGISLGWTWDIVYSGTRENIVEYNHVHHVMRALEDGGGIYSLGLTPGSVIRNNLVHHVGSSINPVGHGIYIDGGSSGLLVENNICHDCGDGGIRIQHGTSCITVLNNISAFCGFGLGIDSERTNIFQYNIVLLDGAGTPFRDVPEWQSYNKIIDRNLYWRLDGKPIKFLGFTWEEWRKKEGIKDIWYTPRMDAHSRIADPKFVDAKERDFRFQPDSPALQMGFRPIDTSRVRLYGEKEWTSLPARVQLSPLLPQEIQPRLVLPADNFDDARPGQKPALASVVENVEKGAFVEITDRRALSKPHSLRFVVAPGLTYYYPHIYYQPAVTGDIRLRLEFDLYREPGAMLWSEWRRTAAIDKVGPCFYIEKDGQLLLNEKRPAGVRLPEGEWIHFEITDGVGALADARWEMKITGQDGRVLFEGKDLPCGPDFDRLLWLGFVAHGTEPAEMYIDNISLRRVEP
ncbi:MAG TPA: right-handed parallel beta-helix repeat-containing protein [Armatimonadota bacterium]|nr:right-handed parallel beta-helix repeat-containing protein [Armatimonadota bacterium]